MFRNLTSGRFLSLDSVLFPKLLKYSVILMFEFQQPGDLKVEVLGLSGLDALS